MAVDWMRKGQGLSLSALQQRSSAERPRGRGARALGEAIAALAQPIVARRGFARGALIAEWPSIVGQRLAAASVPERIAYPPKSRADGTLHLRVASGSLAMELQHLEPVLIEQINSYFGYRAIARVRLIQAPVPVPVDLNQSARPTRPLTADEEASLTARLAEIEDEALRGTLAALGRAVIGRYEPPRS